jgi:hypothetical protein
LKRLQIEYQKISGDLSAVDKHLGRVVMLYGTPPLGTTSGLTLLQIILEQQVSLASAKACYDRRLD